MVAGRGEGEELVAGTGRERSLSDDEAVTHYGRIGAFRSKPRAGVERGMSVLLGRLSPEAAAAAVIGFYTVERDACRHTTVGSLRRRGFEVTHSPSRFRFNKIHCTVEWPGKWDDDVSVLFDRCFECAHSGREGVSCGE